jgi:23S rRNA (adenine-N6)-dimethyltransferase
MAKKPYDQTIQGQNFLRSSTLARALVQTSTIGELDTVYEIGPGRGIITTELARCAHKVIAIEKDPALVRGLHKRFQDADNVQIMQGDFLRFQIPDREYKVFANIPYNITAQVVRKLLYAGCAPREACLVMQKEAAQKFAGSPKATQFSILTGPFWDLRIVREFRRRDFEPAPRVDSALLHIRQRAVPLLRKEEGSRYRGFVRYGFGGWKKSLKLTFKRVFTYQQWKRLSNELRFPLDATPTDLTLEQWLGLFECFKHRVPMSKQACIKS